LSNGRKAKSAKFEIAVWDECFFVLHDNTQGKLSNYKFLAFK